MNIPGTMLNVESKKIEQVLISGPNLQEALDFCVTQQLQMEKVIPQEYIRTDGEPGVLFLIKAFREINLVEV